MRPGTAPEGSPHLAALAVKVLRLQQASPIFPRWLFGEWGAPLQNSRTTCQSNQALEKNGLLASFQQTLLRVRGEVAGPGWKLDPAEGERASYPVEVIFSA